jgi:hypothetical protein
LAKEEKSTTATASFSTDSPTTMADSCGSTLEVKAVYGRLRALKVVG